MFSEPWSDITEYPEGNQAALEKELKKEISFGHALLGVPFSVIARREDRDDILVESELGYFVIHLTWSGKKERNPYPLTEHFETLEQLKMKLASDSEFF